MFRYIDDVLSLNNQHLVLILKNRAKAESDLFLTQVYISIIYTGIQSHLFNTIWGCKFVNLTFFRMFVTWDAIDIGIMPCKILKVLMRSICLSTWNLKFAVSRVFVFVFCFLFCFFTFCFDTVRQ